MRLKCEKCGEAIGYVDIRVFNHDGSDSCWRVGLSRIPSKGVAYIDTTANWTGYEQDESDMKDTISCPHCKEYPFVDEEIQVYDIVRVVMFRSNANKESEKWLYTY